MMSFGHLKFIFLLLAPLITICCSSPGSTRESETNTPQSSEEKPTTQAADPVTSEEIVNSLMTEWGWADTDQLSRFSRDDEVRALIEEQSKAEGERAIAIAYLLITLKHDYAANREKLLRILHLCRQNISIRECEIAIEYGGDLLIEGDEVLLEPLMDLAAKSDGCISESIFSTFGYTLQSNPRLFLQGFRSRSKREQQELGYMTGIMDGAGMDDEMLEDVRMKLRKLAADRRDGLAPVARMCLREIERANKAARAENHN